MNTIWSDFARMIFNVEVEIEGENGAGPEAYAPGGGPGGGSQTAAGRLSYTGGADASPSALAAAAAAGSAAAAGYVDEEDGLEFDALPQVEQRKRRRARADRPQRPVLVRVRQEIQEVSRRVGMATASASEPTPQRLKAVRDQLTLLADYL